MAQQLSPARAEYLRLLRLEREKWIYERTLRKVRVITRTMTEEAQAEYLAGPSFRRTYEKACREDPVWQGLERGELIQARSRAEADRLEGLIAQELSAGREVSLPFLRSVADSRQPLALAREALALVENGVPARFYEEQRAAQAEALSRLLEAGLRARDMSRLYPETTREKNAVEALMKGPLCNGLSNSVIHFLLPPPPLAVRLRQALEKAYPALRRCSAVRQSGGEPLSAPLRAENQKAKNRMLADLRAAFPPERIRKALGQNPSLRARQKRIDEDLRQRRQVQSALLQAIPEHYRDLYPLARQLRRRFYLHIGPTNSGKTYEGIQRLHAAQNGIYLGPLRLLAAEQFEALNLDSVPCTLLTGEEQIEVPFSRVQSSTVEMADLNTLYDIAVIDECQMIADRDRGGAWSAAILGLQAEEIHACASPDAEGLLTRIIQECGDELTVVRHERMTPLVMEKERFQFPGSVHPGDALIVFSKARVHAVAAELKNLGYRVSLIYGALPPDVRRNQADRFMKGETDVVVSTDAIAMGMNLPIERVVFLESEKYDGDITRTLTDAEIKQIAGRAGRYGIYDTGYVNAFGFQGLVSQALSRPLLPLTEGVIRFPDSLLGLPLPLTEIIDQWVNMQDKGCFSKASTERMAALAHMMESKHTDKLLLYRFLCIPFDETDPDLLSRWKLLYQAEARGEHIDPLAEKSRILIPEECTVQMLDGLEADYRRWDLYYNYTRLFLADSRPVLEEIQRRKDLISQDIVHILSTQKLPRKTCPGCRRPLPWNWPHRLCDTCFSRAHFVRRRSR